MFGLIGRNTSNEFGKINSRSFDWAGFIYAKDFIVQPNAHKAISKMIIKPPASDQGRDIHRSQHQQHIQSWEQSH